MANWYQLPINLPSDTEVVWVRIKFYYGTPVLATYSFTNQNFTSVVNSIIYPGYLICRWLPQ